MIGTGIGITLTGLAGVFVQLSYLPVQVGVPGLELEVVKRLDMEVWTFDLQVRAEHALMWLSIPSDLPEQSSFCI